MSFIPLHSGLYTQQEVRTSEDLTEQRVVEECADSPNEDKDHCPSWNEHRNSFPKALLERWTGDFVLERTGSSSYLVCPFEYNSYRDYLLYHPEFRLRRNFLRAHEMLFVIFIFVGASVNIYNAVIRWDLRCSYCCMVGRTLSVHDSRKPCCDPFIQAKEGRVGFGFPGVVAFFHCPSQTLIKRKHWSWSTLGNLSDKEVIAVYSRKGCRYNWVQDLWVKFKISTMYDNETNGILYIEDISSGGTHVNIP